MEKLDILKEKIINVYYNIIAVRLSFDCLSITLLPQVHLLLKRFFAGTDAPLTTQSFYNL
jgi:hypothetical protein